jgi:hypothetical protein
VFDHPPPCSCRNAASIILDWPPFELAEAEAARFEQVENNADGHENLNTITSSGSGQMLSRVNRHDKSLKSQSWVG